MADGPVSSSFTTTSSSSSSNIQQQKGKEDNDLLYNNNVVLANSVQMIGGNLENLSNSENQLVIRDALRLQRDLLQMNIAVPVKLKLVEKSIRDFRGFCAESQALDDEKEENGNDSAQQTILSLLENVATSAAVYAKQLRDSTPKTRDSLSSSEEPILNSNDKKRQERQAQKRQKKQQKVDQLLEKISQMPSQLMFGVRIRRKYADEVAKRYGLEPQPYYADLSDSDSISSFSSHASSSDESSLVDNKIGYNSTIINGVKIKKTTESTTNKSNAKVNPAPPTTPSNQNSTINTAKSKTEQKKLKKQSEPVIQKSKNKKLGRESESLDMLGWMDRLRMEMEQERLQKPTANNGSKLKSVGTQDENLSIPPEAMEILKEALVAAAQDNGKFDDAMNEETARSLAANFIRATAESAAASRHNQGGSSSGEIQPSSSSANAEIPGLSQDSAVEVWKEIQQYLRNLCSTNSAAQELAAKTAESLKTSGRPKEKSIKTPSPLLSQMKPLPDIKNDKKKKRKTKANQASPYPESVLERRRELLRLQAEKQQEHAMVVAQLREQEAKLRDAVAAAQRSSINFKPPECPPFKIGTGPFGATYQHEDFKITAHTEWLDSRMIARGLRVYILIRAIERHRLFDYCEVRRHEAQFCLFLHCDKYRSGFLSYLCSGNEPLGLSNEISVQSASEASELVSEFDTGDIAFYDTICAHSPKWKKIEWPRMCNYHKRFLAMDLRLPKLTGDFVFLMNQLHAAYESTENYNKFRLRQNLSNNKRHPNQCQCNICNWDRENLQNPTVPPAIPFDPRQHNVELFLPTNYVLGRSINEQRRLLRNQAQLSEKCVVVPRKPIADEENAWSNRSHSNATTEKSSQQSNKGSSKKASIEEDKTSPLPIQTPTNENQNQTKQKATQKKKKRK